MTKNRSTRSVQSNSGHQAGHASGQTYDHVLVICSVASLQLDRLVHEGSVLVNARLEDVTPDLLDQLRPDCVLTPLVGRDCDVLEVAAHLTSLGYRGLLLAVTDPLPNPAPIKAEIRATISPMRFDLIEIPQDN